jgi:hypothetical protein
MKQSCPASLPEPASKLASFKALPVNNEAAMYEALKNGPIAVSVTVDSGFQEYAGGIYASATCKGSIGHAVVIVGAGTDDTEQPAVDFWVIRNRWVMTHHATWCAQV